MMKAIWKSNNSDKMKGDIFTSTIEPTLLYNAETYITKTLARKVNGIVIPKCTWQQKVSNEILYHEMATGEGGRRGWRWLGIVLDIKRKWPPSSFRHWRATEGCGRPIRTQR